MEGKVARTKEMQHVLRNELSMLNSVAGQQILELNCVLKCAGRELNKEAEGK